MSQTFTNSNKSFPSLICLSLLPAPSSSSAFRRMSNGFKNGYTLRRFTSAQTDLRPQGDSFKSDKRTPSAAVCRGCRLTEQRRRKWTLRGGWLCWFLLILSHVWLLPQENKKLPNKVMTGLYVCRIRPCSWQLLNKLTVAQVLLGKSVMIHAFSFSAHAMCSESAATTQLATLVFMFYFTFFSM